MMLVARSRSAPMPRVVTFILVGPNLGAIAFVCDFGARMVAALRYHDSSFVGIELLSLRDKQVVLLSVHVLIHAMPMVYAAGIHGRCCDSLQQDFRRVALDRLRTRQEIDLVRNIHPHERI